jgi:oligoendopeptidase F
MRGFARMTVPWYNGPARGSVAHSYWRRYSLTKQANGPTRWSREALLPAIDGAEFEAVLASLQKEIEKLEGKRQTLSPNLPDSDFLDLLSLVERISALSRRLGSYGYLWYAADTQGQDAFSSRGRTERFLADVGNRTLFFDLWWKGPDDEAASSSASPQEILSQAGIDMTSAEFWQGGFDIIAEMIRELESLS